MKREKKLSTSLKKGLKEKKQMHFYFENCIITAQYYEYKYGSGCFVLTRVGEGVGCKKIKIVTSQPTIRNMFLDQRSQQTPEEGVLRRHTHTNRHCNFMTESGQWANSVKIEEITFKIDHENNMR